MKSNLFFTILFCMICMFISTSCEKAEIRKSGTLKHIEGRSCPVDDCTDCPVDDCCCSIQLLTDPGMGVDLDFCGTTGDCPTTMTCSVMGLPSCPDISGFTETISFTGQGQTEFFCVSKNAPFGITLASPTNIQHQVRLTCQVGQLGAQVITFNLNTPPNKPYWSTDSDCFLTSCD